MAENVKPLGPRSHPTAPPQPSSHPLPKTMKAWQATEFGKPLELRDVPVPQPGPREVLIQVTMSGVCHTDLDMRTGDLPNLKPDKLPRTLGHEGVGRVYAVGPGVTRYRVGDRVCCSCLAEACLCCENCCEGWETACEKTKIGSCHKDGTFAQYYLAKQAFICKIPDEVSDEEAAPINCAGVTSWKALKVSGLKCGQWVVLVGAGGGLGYYAVQLAKAMDLKVIAVDRGDEKVEFLKQFKDIIILDANKINVTEKINELTKKGAHAALVIAPSNEAFEEAPNFIRPRGKLVVVGQPPGEAKFDMAKLIQKCLTIEGTMVGTRCDLLQVLQLLADGLIKSEPTVRDFKDVNNILNDISDLKVTGRMVIRIPGPEHQQGRLRRHSIRLQKMLSERYAKLGLPQRRFVASRASQLVWPLLAVLVAVLFTIFGRALMEQWDEVMAYVEGLFNLK